jgi:hypothetical protein
LRGFLGEWWGNGGFDENMLGCPDCDIFGTVGPITHRSCLYREADAQIFETAAFFILHMEPKISRKRVPGKGITELDMLKLAASFSILTLHIHAIH